MSDLRIPLRVALVLLGAALSPGCSTTHHVVALEVERLEAQRGALLRMRDYLRNNDPTASEDLGVFISASSLNRLLAKADGISFRSRELPEAEITVRSVRLRFDYGVPNVDLSLDARHERWNLAVDVAANAALELTPHPNQPNTGLIRFRVARVEPRAKWKFWDLRFHWFVFNLGRIKAQEYADHLPTVSFPLRHDLSFAMKTTRRLTFDIERGQIEGSVATSEFSQPFVIRITTWFVLPDGIHVYGRISRPGQ